MCNRIHHHAYTAVLCRAHSVTAMSLLTYSYNASFFWSARSCFASAFILGLTGRPRREWVSELSGAFQFLGGHRRVTRLVHEFAYAGRWTALSLAVLEHALLIFKVGHARRVQFRFSNVRSAAAVST